MKSLILSLFLISLHCRAFDFSKEFSLANQNYNAGNFEAALENYKELVKKSEEKGELYYNLANSYFKTGQIGYSIYYYKKALQFLPRFGDISYNLEYSRSLAKDKIEKSEKSWPGSLFPFSTLEWPLIGAILSLLFWGTSLIELWFKTVNLKWIKWAALTFVLLMAYPFYLFYFSKTDFGVVVKSEANVYSGPGGHNVALFSLHEGAEFEILSRPENNWALIQLNDGKKGHISLNSIVSTFNDAR